MLKIIVVLGPTASGKSELAVKIAKSLPSLHKGEIVSADSRQVYKGLDLVSGKVEGKWSTNTSHELRIMNYDSEIKKSNSKFIIHDSKDKIIKFFSYKNIRHHLIDFVPLKKIYTVSDFQKDANKAIVNILSRNKIPIICGGTGLYIDTILGKTFIPSVPPNPKLRKKLLKKTTEKLFAILSKIDSRRAKNIDEHNPARLIRAIEIAKAMGKSPAPQKNYEHPKNVLIIGLNPLPEILKNKIHKRLLERIEDGMIQEIESLQKDKKLTWKRCEELGLECRYIARYLQQKITKEEMITNLEKEINNYAKRQKVWFKRDKNIKWFSDPDDPIIEKTVKTFILE